MKTMIPLTPRDEGFIMLSSHLGDPKRPVLTPKMMVTIQQKVAQSRLEDPDEVLTVNHLERIGVKSDLAQRVNYLMGCREQMKRYVEEGWKRYGVYPITIASEYYPLNLRRRLGFEGPCCLWARGDLRYLQRPLVAVVGSRDIDGAEELFAEMAGRYIGKAGYNIVSGNARGTDRTAQLGAAAEGANVICVVADKLAGAGAMGHLFLSENDYDVDFTSGRALSRNRVIHAMAWATIVSASAEGKGGTWSGTTQNLKNRWSPVACFKEGGPGNRALIDMGAVGIDIPDMRYMRQLVERLNDLWLAEEPCSP